MTVTWHSGTVWQCRGGNGLSCLWCCVFAPPCVLCWSFVVCLLQRQMPTAHCVSAWSGRAARRSIRRRNFSSSMRRRWRNMKLPRNCSNERFPSLINVWIGDFFYRCYIFYGELRNTSTKHTLPFYDFFSGTTPGGWYQKRHSPIYTWNHHPSFSAHSRYRPWVPSLSAVQMPYKLWLSPVTGTQCLTFIRNVLVFVGRIG